MHHSLDSFQDKQSSFRSSDAVRWCSNEELLGEIDWWKSIVDSLRHILHAVRAWLPISGGPPCPPQTTKREKILGAIQLDIFRFGLAEQEAHQRRATPAGLEFFRRWPGVMDAAQGIFDLFKARQHEWAGWCHPGAVRRRSDVKPIDADSLATLEHAVAGLDAILDRAEKEVRHMLQSRGAALPAQTATSGDDAEVLRRVVSLFTGGIADARIPEVARVVKDKTLTVNERLERVDSLFRIPAATSAAQLAKVLGVSRQAVMKTAWWKAHRRGAKDAEIARRRDVHRRRAASYEPHVEEK